MSSGCCSSESWTGHPPCCCLFTTWCERSSAPSLKTVSMGKEQGPYWYQPFFPLSFLPVSYSLRLQGCTPLLTGQGGPSKRRGLTASSNRVLVKALPPQHICRLPTQPEKTPSLHAGQGRGKRIQGDFPSCSLFISCLSSPSDQQAGWGDWVAARPTAEARNRVPAVQPPWAVEGTPLSGACLSVFCGGFGFPWRWARLLRSSKAWAGVEVAACRRQCSPRTDPPHPFFPSGQ